MKQYYDRLFIKEGSTQEDIKNAYKKLAKKFHPDVNQNDDYIEEFKIIQEAYEFLISHFESLPKKQAERFNSDETNEYSTLRKNIKDNFDFCEYNGEIEVEHFLFNVEEIKYSKTIGTNFQYLTSDGIYLIVKLRMINRDVEVRTLSFTKFQVYDWNANRYSSLGSEIKLLGLNSKEMFFEKECQPNLPTFGYLLFEVPDVKDYYLELYGGKTDGCPSYTKRIIPLENVKVIN